MATSTNTINPVAGKSGGIAKYLRQADLWLILGLFGTVLLLIVPVPPIALDFFLAVSIALSLLILLVILYLEDASDFTVFPTLLLCITLFRLALNVATTRLILLDGYAGHIIEAFGNFVVRGNYVVGLVIFLILVLINFIVITKGAASLALAPLASCSGGLVLLGDRWPFLWSQFAQSTHWRLVHPHHRAWRNFDHAHMAAGVLFVGQKIRRDIQQYS